MKNIVVIASVLDTCIQVIASTLLVSVGQSLDLLALCKPTISSHLLIHVKNTAKNDNLLHTDPALFFGEFLEHVSGVYDFHFCQTLRLSPH